MDWSQYTVSGRAANKIYEDSYVSSWTIKEGTTDNNGNIITADTLAPVDFEEGLEKARYIDCQNSNKYNITQTLAETFGVFCVYEYKCDTRGQFIKSYADDNGNIWQGRKVVFYNRAIKTEDPLVFDYQNNLNTISRESDSSEIYTKLYITPIESSTMEDGYISIANTSVNPTLDDFILNFDYLYSVGSITDYQKSFVKSYEVSLHRINEALRNLSPILESLTVDINDAEANISMIENEIASAQETLVEYETLRDNDVTNEAVVKNKDNSYSIIFTTSGDCYSAKLRLEGINASSIAAYDSFEYENRIFSAVQGNLITVSKKASLLENDTNFYLLLDEYGFPSEIYTSLGNSVISEEKKNIMYLELVYSPSNAYKTICEQLKQKIEEKTRLKDSLEESLENDLKAQLDLKQREYDDWYSQKGELNQKLEIVLGPALREGYWTPDSYEDPGEKIEAIVSDISETIPSSGAGLIFDNVLFDGEDSGTYEDSVLEEPTTKYYNYIPIEDIYSQWENQKIENLVIHLQNPKLSYTITTSNLPAGNYYVLYNTQKYYFTISAELVIGQTLELKVENSNLNLYLDDVLYTALSTFGANNSVNLTAQFEGLTNYLGERYIYNNAGFIFAFIKEQGENKIKPVLLLNNTSINYLKYQSISYSFSDTGVVGSIDSGIITPAAYTLYYPRIALINNNVNYDSDQLMVEVGVGENAKVLEKFTNYTILLRDGKPYITLKITNDCSIGDILSNSFKVVYQISRANEMLYLDAKEVARENSQPKYSYSLTVANIPDKVSFIELGQLVYINDHSLGIRAATGYVSEVKLALSEPQKDEITIQNYKTKFEDLFSTITASSEAMKNNASAYNIAAAGFTSSGEIEGSVLQTSINNNNLSFSFSNTNVEIDPSQGIILTNTSPYMNGVYGQVALRGGGIFLSNSIDSNGSRVWSTGITPSGINASMITTGQLDTNAIRIFSGNNLAFQWNPEGIFAYKRNENGAPDLNSYVRYSDKGIQYISSEHTAVDLGWNGLLISAQDGATELTGELGLTVYDGTKNEDGSNYMVRVGRFLEDNEYGLRLYRKDSDGKYIATLITSNNGELWLQDSLKIGNEDNGVGITGADERVKKEDGTYSYPVRIWAGSADKETAPFWVREDGSIRATKAIIEGNIVAKEGTIGGWIINNNSLTSPDELTTLAAIGEERINVNNKFIVNSDGTMKAVDAEISGTIYATSGEIGGMTIDGLAGNLESLIGDTTTLKVVISSSRGTVSQSDEPFITKFTATVYKGNVVFTEADYAKYKYKWEYSSDNEEWFSFSGEGEETITDVPYFDYNDILTSSIYVRCQLLEGGEQNNE